MKRKAKKPAPKPPQTRRGRGRPSPFKPEFVDQARSLAQLGATDREVAEFFKVAESTVHLWKHTHPEFSESLKVGKAVADERVVQSLYRRAVGYQHDAVKIFMPAGAKKPVHAPYVEHVAPDTTACIFWLKNRDKDNWRDGKELTGPGGKDLFPPEWHIHPTAPVRERTET